MGATWAAALVVNASFAGLVQEIAELLGFPLECSAGHQGFWADRPIMHRAEQHHEFADISQGKRLDSRVALRAAGQSLENPPGSGPLVEHLMVADEAAQMVLLNPLGV